MSYSPVQIYGDNLFRLAPDKPSRRANEPHRLLQRWQAPSQNQFTLLAAPPDYPNMRIIAIDPETEIDDVAYDIRLDCKGFLDDTRYIWTTRPSHTSGEEGWNTRQGAVYTRYRTDLRWRKNQRPQEDPIEGITAEADDDKLTKTGAFTSLSTGRLAYFDFASGFTGLTTGTAYYVIKIDADNIKLATTAANAAAGTAINITADGTGGTLRPVIAGYEYMFMTDREEEEDEATDYYHIGCGYKGLIMTDEMPMGVKRRINTTAQALSDGNFDSAILIEPVYTGPASNPTAIATSTYMLGGAMEFDLPQISVTDTMISTNAPPTGFVPGNWIPDEAPAIRIISLTGGADIYHFPSGWKILNLVSEQIPGQSLWLISITWGYQRANTPRSA